MNSSLKLYEITNELRSAEVAMLDMGMDEETVKNTLESLSQPFELKATGCAATIKNIEIYANAKKQRGAEMIAEGNAIERRIDWLKNYLLTNMQAVGISEIHSDFFTISVQNNPQSVEIYNDKLIPEEYMKTPEPPPPPEAKPDKKAILAKLKAGEEVDGCKMVQKRRLVIK